MGQINLMSQAGYAKLVGKGGFEYYITNLSVLLGRKSVKANDVVHIGLQTFALFILSCFSMNTSISYFHSSGDGKLLSRHHLTIFYDFSTSKWKAKVYGKNGARIGFLPTAHALGPEDGFHNFSFLIICYE